MNVQQLLESLAERLYSSASVQAVFGEPVQAEGKVIIPVAAEDLPGTREDRQVSP